MSYGPIHAFVLPLLFAAAAFATPSNRWRPWLLPAGALVHLGALLLLLPAGRLQAADGWLVLDPLGRLLALTMAVLFVPIAFYAPSYLRVRADRPNRLLCGGLLSIVGLLTLVAQSHHLGLLWVALEATTLASAPLIHFNRTPRALEAAWKYLLVCSVGIALALLGSFFLAYAALRGGGEPSLFLNDLVARAPSLSKPWLHAAFVTLVVGYGTKMGLAPMHTWKPDAYGESPGILGAMLAGGLTGGAFVAILRLLAIMLAADEGAFARPILIGLGLLSMTFAAVFMARQKDFKRMLAYSSVEHMGLLVLGSGLGGLGLFGALLHLVNNALTKGVLFLAAGNLHRAYGSKSTDDVRGALLRAPWSAGLLLTGFLAITGSPPFGPFVSEFTIVRAALADGHHVVAGLLLFLLMAVFLGMGSTVLAVVQGDPPPVTQTGRGDRIGLVLPILMLLLLVLGVGVMTPAPLLELLQQAAAVVEVKP